MAALESLLVGLIVTACATFSIWRLMSVRLRLRTLELLAQLPPAMGGSLAGSLRRRTLAGFSGGCTDCHEATHTLNAAARFSNRRPGAPRR